MTELQTLLAMLARAGIPHEQRTNKDGDTIVVVENGGEGHDGCSWVFSDWTFRADGRLGLVEHFE